jgi:hypothetical protein
MMNARRVRSRVRDTEAKSRFKQIGFPPFNTGRENLPVKSGADKLRSIRF